MNYIYKNISGTTAKTLLSGHGLNLERAYKPQNIALYKCRITNTYSSQITADVYIFAVNVGETLKTYGVQGEEYNSNAEVTQTYYFIKSLAIPVGVSVDIFADSPCTYSNNFSLKIVLGGSNDTADLALEYEVLKSERSSVNRRQINKY